MTKRNYGITLVALVITVIILLILAAIALSLITGQNGLFARANHAGDTFNKSSLAEASQVDALQDYLTQYGGADSNNGNGDNPSVSVEPYYGGLADPADVEEYADLFLYGDFNDTTHTASVIGINWDYVIPGYSNGTEGAGSWTSGPTYASKLKNLVVPYEVTNDNKVYEITKVQLGGEVKRGQVGTPLAYFTWAIAGGTTDDGVYRDRI